MRRRLSDHVTRADRRAAPLRRKVRDFSIWVQLPQLTMHHVGNKLERKGKKKQLSLILLSITTLEWI